MKSANVTMPVKITSKTFTASLSKPRAPHAADGFSTNLFWDIDPDDLDLDTQASFVIGRVLNRGMWEDWLRVRDYYGIETIKTVALSLRSLTPKALAFVSAMTDTRKEQYRCYTLTPSQEALWHY